MRRRPAHLTPAPFYRAVSPQHIRKESPADSRTVTRINLKRIILRRSSQTDVTGYTLRGSTDTRCPEQDNCRVAQWLGACAGPGVQVEAAAEQGGDFLGC